MKRSEINHAIQDAIACFERNSWHLPPDPKWDVTDFGLENFPKYGLVLVNLTEEEYCEKIIYTKRDQRTPAHYHRQKKEDIIARNGTLLVQVWSKNPVKFFGKETFFIKVNGRLQHVNTGQIIKLKSGERITLYPGIYHEFYPESEECIIGEVSSHNDDHHDNFFVNANIGRFPQIEEDEPPIVKLVSE